MEKNSFFLAQEALDVSVLLRNVSDDTAFNMVAELLNKSRTATKDLNEYYDYLWCEFSNDEPWEREIKKHRPHHDNINVLEQRLLLLIVNNINKKQSIASQLKTATSIDIKSLIFEMPSFKALPFLEGLNDLINAQIDDIELHSIHGENYSENKHDDMIALIELRDKICAIVNEQRKLEMIRDEENKAAQLEESKFICEVLEVGEHSNVFLENESNSNTNRQTNAA